jgi:hypothetical protein
MIPATIPRRLLAGGALAVACGGQSTPPAPPPVSVIPIAPAAPEPVAPAARQEPPAPTAAAEALSGRRFERVALPRGSGAIAAVAGRDERDVWMVARGSDAQNIWVKGSATGEEAKEIALPIDSVLHWDGSGTTARAGPRCFLAWEYQQTPRTRLVSSRAKPLACNPLGCDYAVPFDRIVLAPSGLALVGTWHHGQTPFPFDLRSRTGRDGRWSCEIEGQTPFAERTVGGAALRLGRNGYRLASLTFDGRELALPPEILDGESNGMAALSVDDIWLWGSESENVWHGKDHAWEKRPAHVRAIALEAVEPGSAWVLGPGKEADVVLRWDVAKATWSPVPAPAGLRATSILARSAQDVWLLGAKVLHHWDGRAFRRIDAPPLEVRAAWLSPAGELWVAGADASAKIHVGTELEDGAGAAYRLPAAPK